MKLVETAIDSNGASYIYSVSEPSGWNYADHILTDLYFSKQSPPQMLASTEELLDKDFNLRPGEIRFFRCEICPTKQPLPSIAQ